MHLMEPEGSPPRSQEPAVCPCSETYLSSRQPTNRFKTYFNIILHLSPDLPKSAVYQVLLGSINELKTEGAY
jgi:hypothetical protein